MKRRNFLKSIPAIAAIPYLPLKVKSGLNVITKVEGNGLNMSPIKVWFDQHDFKVADVVSTEGSSYELFVNKVKNNYCEVIIISNDIDNSVIIEKGQKLFKLYPSYPLIPSKMYTVGEWTPRGPLLWI